MNFKNPWINLLVILVSICFISCTSNEIKTKEGIFRHIEITDKGPIGIIKLNNTLGKSFNKIKKVGRFEYLVIEHNERNKVISSELYKVSANGIISSIEYRNDTGFNYCTSTFEELETQQIIFKSLNWGENEIAPCHSVLIKFEGSLWKESTCLDRKKNKRIDNEGVSSYRYTYDDNRLEKSESYWDINGNPINNALGYHREEYKRNKNGCIIATHYFDNKGNPCLSNKGYHKSVTTVDENCNVISNEYYSIDEARLPDEFGVHKYEYQIVSGLTMKEERFDRELKPTKKSSDGVHLIRNQYDENGNLISVSYFGSSDRAINNTAGYHAIRYTYKDGKFLETKLFLDNNKLPTIDKYGIHKYFYVRNKNKWIIYEAYFDTKGKPIKDNINQVYMIKYNYDSFGRMIAKSYWESDEIKMNRWSGIHRYEYLYNDEGMELEQLSFDKWGGLTKETYGASEKRSKYNSLGQLIDVSYWHKDKPVLAIGLCVEGYHKRKFFYSDDGLIKEILFFDKNGRPTDINICNIDVQAHKVEFIYNGNIVTEQRFYKKRSKVPLKVIKCLENECLSTYGNSVMNLN
ncbi:hypothetical protein [Aquimarina sp. Aq78]|uniref:hypothetical protein n=1 Tax=Aquimarina sp. Aq78 TaxID=1191889 RepID=UPI000D0E64A2|nr:hypothetical protein [Aquimarina sp. Aq78]